MLNWRAGGERGLLFGIPAGIKDNIVTEGLRTTCGSQFLENHDPIYDATVVTKLRAAQSVTIGKLNMDEFAMGGSNENSAFYPVHQPMESRTCAGRIKRRFSSSCRGRASIFHAWLRYGRLDSSAGSLLRRCRLEANLWPCFPLWACRFCFIA